MAHFATFKVLVPAQSTGAANNGAPTPDPQDIYVGPAANEDHKGARRSARRSFLAASRPAARFGAAPT